MNTPATLKRRVYEITSDKWGGGSLGIAFDSVIGESQMFHGREDWPCANVVEIVIVYDPRCKLLMDDFIEAHPEIWNEDVGVPPLE